MKQTTLTSIQIIFFFIYSTLLGLSQARTIKSIESINAGINVPDIAVFSINGLEIQNGDYTPALDNLTLVEDIPINSQSASLQFYILNNSDVPLILTGNPIIDIDSATNQFELTEVFNETELPPNGTAYFFELTFRPTQLGLDFATISISSNDPDESLFQFAVGGSGSPEEGLLQVTGNGIVIAEDASVTSIDNNTDFGSIPVIEGQKVNQFELKNIGQNPLVLDLILFQSGNQGFRLLEWFQPTTLNSNESTTIDVEFDPNFSGSIVDSIDIYGPDQRLRLVKLEGFGQPTISAEPTISEWIEGQTATFNVSRDVNFSDSIIVDWVLTGDVDASDFSSNILFSGSEVIGRISGAFTLDFPVANDFIDEGLENFQIEFSTSDERVQFLEPNVIQSSINEDLIFLNGLD